MNFFLWFDWTYMVFVVPCVIASLIAQIKVKSAFNKYSKELNCRGITGVEAAQRVLSYNGVSNVSIQPIAGKMTDNYNPKTNVISLSEPVYNARTISAVGVAAHEAGHAVQTAQDYLPNKIRSAIAPISNIGSKLSWVFIIIGIFLPVKYDFVLYFGIILYSLAVVFTLVTLPVEFDASRRALAAIRETNMLPDTEYIGAKKVLSAAAMTYLAAAFAAIMQLLRLLTIASRRN